MPCLPSRAINVPGITDAGQTPNANIKGQLGVTPQAVTYPVIVDQFAWSDAIFNTTCSTCLGQNHEYIGTVPTDKDATFNFIFRFSTNAGASWSYCDKTALITSSTIIVICRRMSS